MNTKKEADNDWQKELDDDPEFQEWLDEVQKSNLSALIEEYENE